MSWTLKNGIWRPENEEKPRNKTADRPHWITLLLTAASPVAVLAVILSLLSLQTGRQSMEFGQRAYIAINGLTFESEENDIEGQQTPPTFAFQCLLKNNGNTPAYIRDIHYRIATIGGDGAPINWTTFKTPEAYRQKVIASKEEFQSDKASGGWYLYLGRPEINLHKENLIDVVVFYTDVFQRSHTLTSHWSYGGQGHLSLLTVDPDT